MSIADECKGSPGNDQHPQGPWKVLQTSDIIFNGELSWGQTRGNIQSADQQTILVLCERMREEMRRVRGSEQDKSGILWIGYDGIAQSRREIMAA